MKNNTFKSLIIAPATAAMLATGAQAGGLSDAIVEQAPVEVAPVAPAAGSNSWVVPAIALLLIGAAIASSGSDDDDEVEDEVDEGPITSTFSSF